MAQGKPNRSVIGQVTSTTAIELRRCPLNITRFRQWRAFFEHCKASTSFDVRDGVDGFVINILYEPSNPSTTMRTSIFVGGTMTKRIRGSRQVLRRCIAYLCPITVILGHKYARKASYPLVMLTTPLTCDGQTRCRWWAICARPRSSGGSFPSRALKPLVQETPLFLPHMLPWSCQAQSGLQWRQT